MSTADNYCYEATETDVRNSLYRVDFETPKMSFLPPTTKVFSKLIVFSYDKSRFYFVHLNNTFRSQQITEYEYRIETEMTMDPGSLEDIFLINFENFEFCLPCHRNFVEETEIAKLDRSQS